MPLSDSGGFVVLNTVRTALLSSREAKKPHRLPKKGGHGGGGGGEVVSEPSASCTFFSPFLPLSIVVASSLFRFIAKYKGIL